LLRRYAVIYRKYYDKFPVLDSDEHHEDMMLSLEIEGELLDEAKASGLTLDEYVALHFKPQKD
jgi:hypothetical protein